MITEGLFFLFLTETICCDPSSEPSHRDGSDEGSQPMFSCRINKNYPELSPNTPSHLELCKPNTMDLNSPPKSLDSGKLVENLDMCIIITQIIFVQSWSCELWAIALESLRILHITLHNFFGMSQEDGSHARLPTHSLSNF